MRDLVYYVAVSLDGYIAAPDGNFDAFPVEGDHMPVLLSEFTDAVPAHVLSAIGMNAPLDRFDTVIQGWNSYAVALAEGIERPYAHLREYVATSSHTEALDGVTFTPDALATVRELKQEQGKDIYLCGGGELAGGLLPEIDRLILKRNPVVLGDGIRLFGHVDATTVHFTLERCRSFGSGVIVEEYRHSDR
jgi:dihydrofolate reductase